MTQLSRRGLAFISSQIVQLPLAGVDEKIDEAVHRGAFRDVVTVTLRNGNQVRIGRTKGKTYRKEKI